MHPLMRLVVALGIAVSMSGCSVNADPTTEVGTATTTTTTTTTSTTVDPAGAAEPADGAAGSGAVVRIGPARYDLAAICAAPGAGEVQVALSGTDVNGRPVAGYVQAFLGEPYIGMQVGEGDRAVLFESRLDDALTFEFANDILTFPEVHFVSGLDLETAEFTPAGVGSVAVECDDYERELPPSAIG